MKHLYTEDYLRGKLFEVNKDMGILSQLLEKSPSSEYKIYKPQVDRLIIISEFLNSEIERICE